MKKISIILVTLFSYGLTLAQQSYVLEYEYEDLFGNTSTVDLLVNGAEAVFKVKDERESEVKILENDDPNTISASIINNDELSTFTYSTTKEVYIRSLGIAEREFVYKFDAEVLDWKFSDETKKIGEYNCQKATLDLHGRKNVIWFTTEVPISFGPMRLNGLPGMVIEAYVYDTHLVNEIRINLKLLNISKSENKKVFDFHKDFFTTKKVMTYQEYEKEAIQSMIDKKIYQLAKTAEIAARWAKEDGYESDYSVKYEPNYFFDYFIDVPEGAWEELEKINQ